MIENISDVMFYPDTAYSFLKKVILPNVPDYTSWLIFIF